MALRSASTIQRVGWRDESLWNQILDEIGEYAHPLARLHIAVPSLIEKFRFTPQTALLIGTQVHTPPEGFGKVMSMIEPRMAVAYHFFKDFDTTASINDRIRSTYDGPLSLAQDFMVWNVTKQEIRVRMAVVSEKVWPPPASEKPMLPDANRRIPFSKQIAAGKLDVADVLKPIYDEINKTYGLNEKP